MAHTRRGQQVFNVGDRPAVRVRQLNQLEGRVGTIEDVLADVGLIVPSIEPDAADPGDLRVYLRNGAT